MERAQRRSLGTEDRSRSSNEMKQVGRRGLINRVRLQKQLALFQPTGRFPDLRREEDHLNTHFYREKYNWIVSSKPNNQASLSDG